MKAASLNLDDNGINLFWEVFFFFKKITVISLDKLRLFGWCECTTELNK
jgi:hypothetical protein